MPAITVELPEHVVNELRSEAEQSKRTIEEIIVERITSETRAFAQDFEDAADYVLEKNRELYRRLA
ncbi:MAG: DNA-binding protein [Armatimonadota bacterium]